MRPMRPLLKRLSLCFAITAFAAAPLDAAADEARYSIHQPSMDMQKGLNRLAASIHTPILFDGNLVQGQVSRPLDGAFTRDQLLTFVLEGTGLRYRLTATGVILVYRAATTARTLPEKRRIIRPSAQEVPPPDVVVTGIRRSLVSSMAQSQASASTLDVVTAMDIGKLPDGSVAEALQRISGIQIQRDQGEGAGIAVRGLSQVNSQIDGRSIFTASSGRLLSFEDVPSELLAAIHVHKTPSVDQIEGGLSGVVDLRLRKPFDFKGLRLVGQVNSTYYDNADRSRPQASFLYSNRWVTLIGEVGLLVSGSRQASVFRSDYVAGGSPTTRTDIFDLNQNGVKGEVVDAIVTPQGGGIAEQGGTRLRQGLDAHLQWRPDTSTELYLDAFSYKYRTRNAGTLLFATGTQQYQYPAKNTVLAPGTNVFQSGTWSDLFLDSNSFSGGRISDVSQVAFGGKKELGRIRLSGDVTYNLGHSFKSFYQLALSSSLANPTTGKPYGAAPTVFQDYSSEIPVFHIGGIDLTDTDNFVFDRAIQSVDWVRGAEGAGRLDCEYRIGRFGLKSIGAGIRYSDRLTTEASVYQFDDIGGTPISAHPDLVSLARLQLFDRGGRADEIAQTFLTANPAAVGNFKSIRAHFHLLAPSPADASLSTYRIRERVAAAYLLANIAAYPGSVLVTGNIGFRVIGTGVVTRGMVTDSQGLHQPVNLQTDYANLLPQMNVRAELSETSTLRFSAYQTLTRQDFGVLAPQVTLDFLFHIGGAGNPNLRPLRASNFDIGIEHYDALHNSTYANVFFKRVTGFVQNQVRQEVYFGQTFDITRPENGGTGRVWGAEVGLTRFLSNVPAALKGLGFQANYTFVNSMAPSPISTATLPLEGLSKHSFNLIGFYERGPMSARLGYNYRSPYVITSVTNGAVGFTSDWSQAQAVIDGSLSFAATPHLKITADLANLGNLRSRSYYSDTRLKHNFMETDRRFTVGLQFAY